MQNQKKVWDRLAKRYIASPIANVEAYETKLEITHGMLTPEMEVLEIGCGSGNTARKHAPHVHSYLALDISDEMLKLAREQGPVPDNMTFRQGDFDAMSFEDESFDLVLAMSVLHLVPDVDATLGKIAKCLKSNGTLIASTPCLGGNWLLRLGTPLFQALGLIPHLNFFTPDQLRDKFKAHGFLIMEDWQPKPGAALFLMARQVE